MIHPILQYPDPRLELISSPVTEFDAELETLIDDMIETMLDANGIGLAAPQINIQKNIIVIAKSTIESIDCEDDEENEEEFEPLIIINPTIIASGEKTFYKEGCLSVPLYQEKVPRQAHVRLDAFDVKGHPYTLEATGLLAICIQHELDHLLGKLFINRISPLKKSLYDTKLAKQKK